MIYDQVDKKCESEVAKLNCRLYDLDIAIQDLTATIKVEDSKKREQELKDRLRNLKRERSSTQSQIYAVQEAAFKTLLAEEYGVEGNPKFDKAYQLAYEHGHSSGFSEIESYFSEFVELIR